MIIVAIVVAIALWALISTLFIVVWYQRKQKQEKHAEVPGRDNGEADAEMETERDESDEDDRVQTEESEESPDFRHSLMPPKTADTWREQLGQVPGLLGWLIIESDGVVQEFSDDEFASLGETLAGMVESAAKDSEKLGIHPMEMLEWEGPQGSILVSFPKDEELHERLVLFLGTESYKSEMRELIVELNWESTMKGDNEQ